MYRILCYLFVVAAWSTSPVVKRHLLDYMRGDDGDMGPVITFTALFSLGSCIVLCLTTLAIAPAPAAIVRRIPAEGWTLLIMGVILGATASILLVQLLSVGNPGLTVVFLNAGTSVLGFVVGALLYGQLTWDGVAGVILIAAGVALTRV